VKRFLLSAWLLRKDSSQPTLKATLTTLSRSRFLTLSSAKGPGLILFRGGSYADAEMRAWLERVVREQQQESGGRQ
jgi:hypothetical protein